MTNIVNFERDMHWIVTRGFVTASVASYSSTAWAVGTDSTVMQRANNFQSLIVTTAAGSFTNAGCLILPPPEGDVVPYRCIGSSPNDLGSTTNMEVSWWLGFWDAGDCDNSFLVHVGPVCDKLIAVPAILSGDPDFGKPLCFFASIRNSAARNSMACGSIQRLISKPPQYAAAVS